MTRTEAVRWLKRRMTPDDYNNLERIPQDYEAVVSGVMGLEANGLPVKPKRRRTISTK